MKMASDFETRYDLYVEPLDNDVNTAFSDLAPVEGPGGKLYFTTFNRNSYVKVDSEEEDEDQYARISTTQKNKEGEWQKPKLLNEKINYPGIHAGNAAFSADGGDMFFTRTELSGKKVAKSEVYVSSFDGADWTAPRKLTGINGEYNVLHPVPGELYGENVLFFVSDRPGGLGGYDLYYSSHQGGLDYSLPVNLGETVNSIGDEYSPYYVDGRLYFSSDGHPTMGGMDIFFSNWDGSKWSKPENMGLGYNSRYDDFHFKTNPETEKGFLVSNRPNDEVRSLRGETCCDDIFSVGIKDIEVDVIATIFADKKALLGTTITVAEVNKDGEVISSNSATSKEGNTFKFRLQADKRYRLYANKPGYELDSVDINTQGVDKSYTFKKEFHLEESEPETEIITINEPIRLENIYYDFDDDKILPSAEQDLRKLKGLLEEYPEMVIELSSHTDARGNDAYNMDLSQRRANSAKRWLVKRGVDADRIVAKGYGESQILNECVNGVECSEEKHRKNRRTEFKIIEGPESIEMKKEVIKGKKKTTKGELNIDEEG
jgi:peptidoglycan-associated lipoprotein